MCLNLFYICLNYFFSGAIHIILERDIYCKNNRTTYDESRSNVEILCDYIFFYAHELCLLWGMKNLRALHVCTTQIFSFPLQRTGMFPSPSKKHRHPKITRKSHRILPAHWFLGKSIALAGKCSAAPRPVASDVVGINKSAKPAARALYSMGQAQ
jgi:hypothetical protein